MLDVGRRSLRRVGAAWGRFWFTPASGATFALWRTAVGVTAAAWLVAVGVDLITFFGDGGLRPNPFYSDHRIGLFQWIDGNRALYGVYFAGLIAAIGLIIGRWVRVAGLVVFYAVLSIQLDNTSILNAGDILVRIWFAYFAIFALLTPSRVLRVPLFGEVGSDGVRRYPQVPTWLLRMVQIQMTVIYPAGLFHKLDGSTWRDGTAALYALNLQDFERFPVPDLVTNSLFIGWILTYLTLAIEFSVPFLLWTRRTRRFAVVAGLGLHVGFDYALRVGFFAWAMTVGYIAFLTPGESARIADWVRRALALETWRGLTLRRATILHKTADDASCDPAGASDAGGADGNN